jgi:hypothetical protein
MADAMRYLSDLKRTGDDMKITASQLDRVFGGVITYVGRISIAGFLSGLSSTSVVESKPLNNYLIAVGLLACLLVLEQKNRVKALGGLSLAWAGVKLLQWNAPVRWHWDIAFVAFFVLVYHLRQQSTPSAESAV